MSELTIYEKAVMDCWNAVNALIKPGPLTEKWQNDQRNGYVMATNVIMALKNSHDSDLTYFKYSYGGAINKKFLGVTKGEWMLAEDAPAGREGIVRQELEKGMWCYHFGEWRVVSGTEDWFTNEGTQLANITHWFPMPDDPIK